MTSKSNADKLRDVEEFITRMNDRKKAKGKVFIPLHIKKKME